MALVKVADKQINKTLFDLWRMSFYQLDDVTQKRFVNHLSNYINRISVMKAFDCATFELKRYESRNFDDKIIAEFYCTFCKSDYKYIVLEVLSYLSYIFNQPDEKVQEILDNLKCEHCKESKFEMDIVVL